MGANIAVALEKMLLRAASPRAHEIIIQRAAETGTQQGDQAPGPLFGHLGAHAHGDPVNNARPGTTPGDPDAIHQLDEWWDLVVYYGELFDRLGLASPALVGHSFGGMLACEIAAAMPARTGKLVLSIRSASGARTCRSKIG